MIHICSFHLEKSLEIITLICTGMSGTELQDTDSEQ